MKNMYPDCILSNMVGMMHMHCPSNSDPNDTMCRYRFSSRERNIECRMHYINGIHFIINYNQIQSHTSNMMMVLHTRYNNLCMVCINLIDYRCLANIICREVDDCWWLSMKHSSQGISNRVKLMSWSNVLVSINCIDWGNNTPNNLVHISNKNKHHSDNSHNYNEYNDQLPNNSNSWIRNHHHSQPPNTTSLQSDLSFWIIIIISTPWATQFSIPRNLMYAKHAIYNHYPNPLNIFLFLPSKPFSCLLMLNSLSLFCVWAIPSPKQCGSVRCAREI